MATTKLPVVGLNVTPLPDNKVWFANSASWTSYWKSNVTFTIDAPVADTVNYGLVKTAATTIYVPVATPDSEQYNINIDPLGNGVFVAVNVPSIAYVKALQAQVVALDAAVQQMRIAMVNAGIINHAQ